jgi:hypothetical protein
MFARIRLYWLELLLQHRLGGWHAYCNFVHDQPTTSTKDRIAIAQALLHGPPLERSRRWYEYVRVVQRGERP